MSSDLKVALVHDYLNEFGGAERVLLALAEIWPKAPIYTAFYNKKSSAGKRFSGKDIRASWYHYMPFASRLASPLRFIAPLIWSYFDFSEYDIVIGSANWYITKGFKKKGHSSVGFHSLNSGQAGGRAIEICYCHTPPRYLYGYRTSVNWQKYWLVRVYGLLVGHFLRMVDFRAAHRVDYFIANSKNVANRIEKFYRRKAKVIYPPIEIPNSKFQMSNEKREYYLIVSRIVGGKGLDLAIGAANEMKISLKVVGKGAGWGKTANKLRELSGGNIEFLGEVSDEELINLYSSAKAFLAVAFDEDFGISPVEAMACGTPVIAYNGGGYRESVIAGKTGVFFEDYSQKSLAQAIKDFETMSFSEMDCRKQAEKFSKARFKKEIQEFVEDVVKK